MKQFIICTFTISLALLLFSCKGIDLVNEDEDIESGRFFKIPQGTVEYKNTACLLTFSGYGQRTYFAFKDSTSYLYMAPETPGANWKVYITDKVQGRDTSFVVERTQTQIEDGDLPFVREAQMTMQGTQDGYETIVGIRCNKYTDGLETLCSWNRIEFKYRSKKLSYEAVSFSNNAVDSLLMLK